MGAAAPRFSERAMRRRPEKQSADRTSGPPITEHHRDTPAFRHWSLSRDPTGSAVDADKESSGGTSGWGSVTGTGDVGTGFANFCPRIVREPAPCLPNQAQKRAGNQ